MPRPQPAMPLLTPLPPRHNLCKRCLLVKPHAAFDRRKCSPWFHSWCKACRVESRRRVPEAVRKAWNSGYHAAHREHEAERHRAYLATPMGRLVAARYHAVDDLRRAKTERGRESARLRIEAIGCEIERLRAAARKEA